MTLEQIVDATLERVGRRIVLGTPLGLGKANHLVNAFYRRAEADPSIHLTVFTALTLAVPRGDSELERRLRGPMNERIFGDFPEIAWVEPLRNGDLPQNIVIREFYVQPGTLLGSPLAQQNYTSSNYTHVVRDLLDAGMNVLAQMVGAEEVDGRTRFSLSCNSDLTVDLLPHLLERREASGDVALLAQVNRRLPFLYGDAMVDPDVFDFVADGPDVEMPLFGPPKLPLSTADHMIGLHVSTLVRDGGTLQLGIGSLGDAIVHALRLRHGRNDEYRRVVEEVGVIDRSGHLGERWGGLEPFQRGLYAATEMLVDGFLDLYRDGILNRRVYPDADVQRALDAGDLDESELGDLAGEGRVAHSCFFLGPQSFYDGLRELPRQERELFEMTGISFVNELYGDEKLKRAQRRHARFVNSCMMMTVLGAAVSDGLADGRVVSGVGGQYNFVAMAQALDDGRSILMLPSTRWSKGETTSNVRWNYGHTTIPRHLRDLAATEYGIADLRGKSDADCIRAMLGITESRFQDELLERAKSAGKLPSNERLPDEHRENTPERLDELLDPHRDHFPTFPSGTDLTDEELVLAGALRRMKRKIAERDLALLPKLGEVKKLVKIPEEARPYLERMGLAEPETTREKLLRRAVVYALIEDGAV